MAAVTTPAEFQAFRQQFWGRRNPTGDEGDNSASALFFARVADADRLYSDEDHRGSVTDRGGALILLGPPNILRHRPVRVPALGAGTGSGPRQTVQITEEIWVYFTQDLAPPLRDLLRREYGPVADVSFTFVRERRGTRMTEGRELLRLARRALVVEPPGPP
ncbi:MAG: GWxTD domain-containing protein [Thermoanaerobaculia bacterium]|nr:GWxTD domain-containing protein [Thermoanaerobaculia bacterium]